MPAPQYLDEEEEVDAEASKKTLAKVGGSENESWFGKIGGEPPSCASSLPTASPQPPHSLVPASPTPFVFSCLPFRHFVGSPLALCRPHLQLPLLVSRGHDGQKLTWQRGAAFGMWITP